MASCFLFLLYKTFEDRSEKDYASRYESATLVMRNSIMDQEDQIEYFSTNAANFLKSRTLAEGLPKQHEMATLANELHVSYLAIIDSDGAFIRDSVREPDVTRPKLFEYCEGYKNLIKTSKVLETTPILPTQTMSGPFKFTMVAGEDKRYIFEVGMRADFIEKALSSIVSADSNILDIGLYSPNGFSYGRVEKNGTTVAGLMDTSIAAMPFGVTTSKQSNLMRVVTKISAPVADCCECKIKGVSGSDHAYYYKLVMHVSTAPLHHNLTFIRRNVAAYVVLVAILSLIISCLGGWFVYYRFERLSKEITRIVNSGSISNRLNVGGKDEVSAIGRSFDQLLSTIEIAQKELVETEKNRTLLAIAKQVAHDIRSPLATLSSITKDIKDPDKGELIKHAVGRIKQITDDLSAKWRQKDAKETSSKHSEEWISTKAVCSALMDEKLVEHKASKRSLHFECSNVNEHEKVNIPASDFSRAVSNLINNAVEAVPEGGNIWLRLRKDDDEIAIDVEDDGAGVDEDDLEKIFDKGFTKGKEGGTGLGLDYVQSFVAKYKCRIEVNSQKGRGSIFSLYFPFKYSPAPQTDIVLFDDDPWIREIWTSSLLDNKRQIRAYSRPEELLTNLDSLKKSTVFFVDLYWEDKLVGFHLAEEIYSRNFTEIYICTGVEGANIEPLPSYIKGVVGKQPPGWL